MNLLFDEKITEAVDKDGSTPLHLACANGMSEELAIAMIKVSDTTATDTIG